MIIASISENKNFEKRIAITPEIAKKYISNGFEVYINRDYGTHLGFLDEEYKSLGVKVLEKEEEVINSANIVVQLELPKDEKLVNFKENQILIGVLNSFSNKEKLKN